MSPIYIFFNGTCKCNIQLITSSKKTTVFSLEQKKQTREYHEHFSNHSFYILTYLDLMRGCVNALPGIVTHAIHPFWFTGRLYNNSNSIHKKHRVCRQENTGNFYCCFIIIYIHDIVWYTIYRYAIYTLICLIAREHNRLSVQYTIQ